jgi:hypothetical protein
MEDTIDLDQLMYDEVKGWAKENRKTNLSDDAMEKMNRVALIIEENPDPTVGDLEILDYIREFMK